ncbi:hypothetical protein IX332_001011 [Porphyromonas levii]|nr:hypothetical protein [Porphyromonas levii]MBR8729688.1 hypothetical protein [Porphyromonas levii]MBR8759195.1 hypothetical protein [Porphyromonas levii]MBR8763681.1 hypothetical protein [Porphyromonas levii]MBR8764755.1 hypothetical protein [Porphyromonas levii]
MLRGNPRGCLSLVRYYRYSIIVYAILALFCVGCRFGDDKSLILGNFAGVGRCVPTFLRIINRQKDFYL